MDADLKCNNLTCRRALSDKAVVAHIYSAARRCPYASLLKLRQNFSVDCANQLFTVAQLCPACETHLTEPDDVVVSSLHPSNDYKTSVLSGLSPSAILEICGRAISFWQYQAHQESSFQQVMLKNVNEKNTQLQKHLENIMQQANGEIDLLNNKVGELIRELEMERRKVRELQDSAREHDKEYQKLKNHFEKIKRKTLISSTFPSDVQAQISEGYSSMSRSNDTNISKPRPGNSFNTTSGVDINALVGGMEAHGIQRTPIRTGRGNGGSTNTSNTNMNNVYPSRGLTNDWTNLHQGQFRHDRHAVSATLSERSASADEVENMLHSAPAIPSRPQQRTAFEGARMMPGNMNQNTMHTNITKKNRGFRAAVRR